MGDVHPLFEESVSCYEKRLQEAEAAGIKVRALQISNPHNPSGKYFDHLFPISRRKKRSVEN